MADVITRKERLAQLKNRRITAQIDNKNDTRVESSKPAASTIREERPEKAGEDDERIKSLAYTIHDQEKWDEKLAERAERDQPGFSTYEYNKSVSNVYRDAHSLDYATQEAPVPESIDKMAADLDAQLNKRDNRSKRRAVTGDEEVSYINERNRHFNKKIGRAFDKYTKDIKASLERGTALDDE